MTLTDPNELGSAVLATIGILLESPIVQQLAADRVYGGSVPETVAANELPPTIVVAHAGAGFESPGSSDYIPMTTARVDVWAYADSEAAAERLSLAAHHALKNWRRGIIRGHRVEWVNHNNGPVILRDTSVGWPALITTYTILIGDERA